MFYLTKLFFRDEGETTAFKDKQKLKEVSTIKPNLQDILKRCSSSWNEKILLSNINHMKIYNTLVKVNI